MRMNEWVTSCHRWRQWVCERVCYLARVFYQDQTAAWALAKEDSALLSPPAGTITLLMQREAATGVVFVRGKKKKLLRLGIWWWDFTHICLTQHAAAGSLTYKQFSSRYWRNLSVKAFPILDWVFFQTQTLFSVIIQLPLTLPRPSGDFPFFAIVANWNELFRSGCQKIVCLFWI